jgi:small-conductance mechanosensitive channel/CRP-like cAMP-binding protein
MLFDASLILPLVGGFVGLGLLIAILSQLRRNPFLRTLSLAYTVGVLALSIWGGLWLANTRFNLIVAPTIWNILTAVLIFCWGYVALGVSEYILTQRLVRNSGIAIPRLARDIVRAIALTIAILITLQIVFNITPSSILISSTLLSAVIGLALQDLLKNVIAGVALQLERPFDIGHWIQVGDGIGKVVEMSWRATNVITVDGNYIIYPNSDLATSRVINYTLPEPRQAMHTQIALSYVHPPNTIKRVLYDAMLASPDVTPDPTPSVKVLSYGDYSVTYDLKFWLYNYDNYPDKRDKVMTNAWYALQRSGISMPLPVREVYHHEEGPDEQALRRREHLARMATDLRVATILDVLNEQELAILVERVHARLYGAGDLLVRQDDPGETLFILRSGRVRVDVRNPNGTIITVNRIGPGECFGEMALMTGEPRGASVIAEEDTEVLVVSKDDLAPLLRNNAKLPERLGEMLNLRREMNRLALERQQPDHLPSEETIPYLKLVDRIRQFFGLGRDEP